MFDAMLSGDAVWFSVPALLGTFVFVLRVVLMMVGGDGDMDLDMDSPDIDLGDIDAGDHGSDEAFTVLSVQGVAAFMMGFGWGGIGGLLGAGWSVTASLAAGAVGGVLMTWLLAWLMSVMVALQSSGTVNREGAIGHVGDVYLTVPSHGQGKGQVRVVIGKRQRIYEAVSDGGELPSQSRVRVLAINDDKSLTVTPA